MNFFTRGALAAILGTAAILSSAVAASAAEVNVYSSRHYDTDKSLYQTFTQQTGIKVNIIEGRDDELIERIGNLVSINQNIFKRLAIFPFQCNE